MEQHRQRTTLPQFRSRLPTLQHGRCQKGSCHEDNKSRKCNPAPLNTYVSAHLIGCAEDGDATSACSDSVRHRLCKAIVEVCQASRVFVVEPVEALDNIGSETCLKVYIVSLVQYVVGGSVVSVPFLS
jgi:hypothetical protein